VNVCRHRGHLVAQGCGRRETLQCRYHAWTYNLDGSLRRAPRSERETGFDPDEWGLLPVQVDVWERFVFVNPDLTAAPLAPALADLSETIRSSGLDLDRLRFRERIEWENPVNWKISLENYLECYHCPVAHPSFSKMYDVDPDAYVLRSGTLYSSQLGPVRESALRGDGVPYVPRGDVKQAQYHFVWPDTTIDIEAGPANLAVSVWRFEGPHKTVGCTDYFFGEDVTEEEARAMREFGAVVGAEDAVLVRSVQAGLDSGMIPHGRLLLSSEHLIAHFQRLVADALAPAA
jgi:choline monooxygenase